MKKSLIFSALLAMSFASFAQNVKTLTIEMEEGKGKQNHLFINIGITGAGFIRQGRALAYTKEVNSINIDGIKKYEVVSGEVEEGLSIFYDENGANVSLNYDVEIKDMVVPGDPLMRGQLASMKNVSFSFPLDVTSEKRLVSVNKDWKIYYKIE